MKLSKETMAVISNLTRNREFIRLLRDNHLMLDGLSMDKYEEKDIPVMQGRIQRNQERIQEIVNEL